jgi:hypothetical protein
MSRTCHAVKTVVLAGALLMTSSACSTQHARPARSTVGCAEAVVGQLPPALTDPEKHCLASALMVQQCSRAEAWLAGWGKEAADAFGAGDADWDDLRADRVGRDCAGTADSTTGLLACCRDGLPQPDRSTNGPGTR